MTEQLIGEKQAIEETIKSYEKTIEQAKTFIHWQKKRLKLVEQQIESMKDADKVDQKALAEQH